MKHVREFFRSHLVRILCGGFLMVIVPVLILCIVSNFMALRNLRQEMENSYLNSIQLVAERFAERLNELQVTMAAFLINDDAVRLSSRQAEDTGLYEFVQFESPLELSFSSQFMPVNAISVFPDQGLAVSTEDGVERLSQYPGLSDLASLEEESWFWALRPSYRDPEKTCLSIVVGYVHAEQSRPIMIVEMEEKDLIDQLETLLQESIQIRSAFFVDPFGNSVRFDKSGSISDASIRALWEQVDQGAEPAALSVNEEGEHLRLVPSHIPGSNCIIGIAFNETEVLRPVLIMVWLIVFILIFSAMAAVAYLLWTFRAIYGPVQQLLSGMRRVASGDLNVQVRIKGNDEFAAMAEQFNSMVQQLDKLLKEKYLSEVRLKKAQMKFLKSQINPHFLYNTLFGVYNMIKSEELDDAAEMVIYLGQYYQIGAHLEEEKLTVSQEMNNIELYLKIHQIRTRGRLEYQCTIADGLEDFAIPSLSLQTVVENSVTHAFRAHQQQERILVRVFREEGWIVLLVEDNGSGISPEEKQKVLDRLHQPDGEEVHGLQNVYLRMQLMFGDEVEVQVASVEPHGTRIVLRIPVEKEENHRV